MPSKNPRINAVFEPPLYEALKRMAQNRGVSLSTLLRDLALDAAAAEQDAGLLELAERRNRGFNWSKAAAHGKIWR